KDIDEIEPGGALPLGIWVEVAGRKMQPDFESILERQIHHLVNGAEGIWHMGQRDIVWTRVSNAAFDKGVRLKDYGEIIHAKFLSNYPAIVDKVKVTLVTDMDEVVKRQDHARRIYQERNRRLASMTDESVDTFYSCLLCQSFAPNHVCVITPERLGLCGAYNWLDGKAAYEIDETGPNQPVKKGELIDPVRGIWAGVDEYVYSNSHKTVESFSLYSIMNNPMTSCGCFEVICAYVPECNGIMAVNREYTGDTPVGMTFSSLAGNVGGGAQTPGFMGIGKVFLTSRKFLFTEGGHRRIVWLTQDLKDLLGDELKGMFADQGYPDFFDKIADESVSVDPSEIRAHMEKVGHPALTMDEMALYGQEDSAPVKAPAVSADKTSMGKKESERTEIPVEGAPVSLTSEGIAQIKNELMQSLREEIKSSLTKEIVTDIINVLGERFLGSAVSTSPVSAQVSSGAAERKQNATTAEEIAPKASERISAITSFPVRKESSEQPIHRVKLGASKAEGGTRGITYEVGGATAMPFHFWEGEMPNRPLVAIEVFDTVSEKYPPVMRSFWGDLLEDPAAMAKACVEKYGADLVSVRLEGTHPEKGGRTPADALKLVKSVLDAVEVPVIVTGHNHYESMNEVMKEVGRGCAGENLLLNWVEQDNFRTIAGVAIAYGHTLVAQSPIDVNIAKQLNILLTNMDIKPEQIIIDPMTGAMGYGIEYTYSVMERIRITGLGGDGMLAHPMILSPGQECAKIKELKAPEADFPMWGDLGKRAALWELATATSMLYAGADILIMYHPEAAVAMKKTIGRLMRG
ncbi:MAG TPA: CO dehydrogenase/CO-methylating acetyl-CoA synthase complex subunit beta, partial [Spirochaetota bacterium]|nr:CO dehydrogenase/CO-methylating acetyl-CoA synthase complex subunit beta [Spirochaetota bacterium]